MSYTPKHLTEDELINHLPETIGQVSLNYDYYPGKDLYSDGAIEDELLNIVKNASRVEYQSIIEQKKSWPILYHLSHIRGNIVDFLPITKEDKVLEIGSGCGAITDTLSRKAGSVTCVDLSAKRSMVNAYRNQDRDNINIYVGNFNDIEPHLDTDYDYVCFIGVFEYGSSYIKTKTPYEDFLKIALKHAKNNGRVVIAIENKFGLKYWAGCKEDHVGDYFSSLEGYPKGGSARTFTRDGLENIFEACGVNDYSFYYPYPDYKLPTCIYSDKRLPSKGELTENIRNLDRDRLLLFNESLVFDQIIDEGQFPLFSNSYIAVIGPAIDLKYIKYSNDRSEKYAISTSINSKDVVKKALNGDSKEHLKKLERFYELLNKRYEGSGLRINKCSYDESTGEAHFDFEKGVTLEELMDEALFSGDKKRFNELFDKYYKLISYNNGVEVSDYDLIFANILVDGDDFVVIDYEWTVLKDIPAKELAYRALYCYILEDDRRNALNVDEVMALLDITPNEREYYQDKELEFQKSVTGNHESIGEIVATIGTHVFDAKKLADQKTKDILNDRIQVFYDEGTGYSEGNSRYIPDVYESPNHIVTDIEFNGNVKRLRIDPADYSCLVKINEMILNGENILSNKKSIQTNGKTITFGTYAFATQDPNIILILNDVLTKGENVLHVEFEVTPISSALAEDISASVKKLF